jgi:pimeloyl-ACP methyl ester carboxylesterase
MQKKKIINKALASFLLFFVLSLFAIVHSAKAVEISDEEKWQDYEDFIVIDHDTEWSGNVTYNDPYKPVAIVNGATLTIKKGTHIEIVEMYIYTGRIMAEGTESEKIIFTKAVPDTEKYGIKPNCLQGDKGIIRFSEDGWLNGYEVEPSVFRYVEFNGMGSYDFIDQEECACPYLDESCQAMHHNIFRKFFNTAVASDLPDETNPALRFESGRLHIENSTFKDNHYSDVEIDAGYYEEGAMSYLEIVNSNFEGNKQNTALISSAKKYSENDEPVSAKNMVILKNNWYGYFQGPTQESDEFNKGEKISGDYTLNGYRSSNLISDPVIVIPGIMGSFEVNGKLFLDPIAKIYDNLMRSLNQNGYQKNINLFDFPYEWRNSNVLTANELKQKIQDVKNDTGVSRVDLVAHSMGGLVSRSYIEGENYQNDVDQLITLGTPHKGSPKSYLTWEAGETGNELEDNVIERLFALEAKHNGYDNLKEYIQNKIVSVGELLPDYDYLEENGEIREYPNEYPRNEFLEDLNDQNNLSNLDKVSFINVISKNKDTISKFRIIESSKEGKWEHGMPENYYDKNTDQGIEYGNGDRTVPFESSTGIDADKIIELDAAHNQLPSRAQCKVLAELSNKTENNCQYINDVSEIISILTFGVFSPIDIQIVAPNGKKVGKNFDTGEIINEIDGAYYSGFDGVDNEFLTIPNPIDGEYKIIAQGTGNGEYKVETTKISEDETTQEAKESTATIEGIATVGQQEEKTVTVENDEVITESKDIIPPTIIGKATTEPNENGWYDSDVTIHFEATDNESGIDTITPDLIISTEGANQSVVGTAKDKAGNEASVAVSGINIDKTAPEAKITFNQAEQKLDILGIDNLSQNVSVATKEQIINLDPEPKTERTFPWFSDIFKKKEKKKNIIATLSDEAGHKTEVTFEKKKNDNHHIDISLKSISYDGEKSEFSKSLLQYKWFLDWRRKKYNLFGSHIMTESELLESHYRPKKNETWIMTKPRELDDDDNDDDAERRPVWKKLPGMIIPYLQTERGKIVIKY